MTADLPRRHRDILDILAQRGYAAIEELVEAFDVTPQTLRRDLQELADRGLLRRHHGGASVHSSTANADYGLRHVETAEEKARIGHALAELIAPGTSIFVTPGTTVEAAAKAIAERRLSGLHVITNSIAIATILDNLPDVTIHLTGGLWLRRNRTVAGMAAAEFAARFRCDVHIASIGAIDSDGALLEYRDEDATVARTMLGNARRRILLADHSKFSRSATCVVGNLRDIDTLITDRKPSAPVLRAIRNAQCELIVAK